MVKIRLQRRGRKKLPVYKIVAADSRAPRDGRFIEALGQYAPVSKDAQLTVDRERVLYWLGKGARPSDTVRSLLSREGIMLHVHLQRKGKSPEDIESTLAAWLEARNVRAARQSTKKQQRTARKKAAEAVKTEETAAPASEAEAATASEASPEG